MRIASILPTPVKALAFATACMIAPLTAQAHEIEDVLGRKIDVPDQVERIVLGEGRLSYALALVDKEHPFSRIVGWQNDLRRLDPHTFEAFQRVYPEVTDIPVIGQASEVSVNVETILNLKPDLVIFSVAGEGPKANSPIADTLAQAGIPVLYVDFRVHPAENTPRSIEMIGEAIGRQDRARAFSEFYRKHVEVITSRVAKLGENDRPTVFAELLPGVWQTPGHTTGNSGLGQFIAWAGGRNIAADVVPGAIGDIAVEYALSANPDIYIATGNRAPGLVLGPGVDPQEAKASFKTVLERPEFAQLKAIRDNKAYGLWHDFYASPYNIVAMEALATWLHPDLFADVDPSATMQEIRNRFLGFDNSGLYWIAP